MILTDKWPLWKKQFMPWNKIFPSNQYSKESFVFREAMGCVYILKWGGGTKDLAIQPVSYLEWRKRLRWVCILEDTNIQGDRSTAEKMLRSSWFSDHPAWAHTCSCQQLPCGGTYMSNGMGIYAPPPLPKPVKSETLKLEGLVSPRVVIQCANCTWPLGDISHTNQNTAEDFIDYWTNEKPKILL